MRWQTPKKDIVVRYTENNMNYIKDLPAVFFKWNTSHNEHLIRFVLKVLFIYESRRIFYKLFSINLNRKIVIHEKD
jgi:hypothetical protein